MLEQVSVRVLLSAWACVIVVHFLYLGYYTKINK